jgi:hypothetical protein
MAEGETPFEIIGLWEKMSDLSLKEIKALPPRERLGLGYYVCAKRRAEQLKEVT